jgi:hypothetical protein
MLKELYAFSVERKKKKVLGKWVFGIEMACYGRLGENGRFDGWID